MKIFCVDNNYSVDSLQSSGLANPVFYLKPETSILRNNRPFYYPEFSSRIAPHVGLVFRICKVGKSISARFASRYYDSVGVSICFTAVDILERCAADNKPRDIATGFDNSMALSPNFVDISQTDICDIGFALEKNGQMVQSGSVQSMVFGIDRLVSYISKFMMLKIGDLIFSGAAMGVVDVAAGDTLNAYINNSMVLTTRIV